MADFRDFLTAVSSQEDTALAITRADDETDRMRAALHGAGYLPVVTWREAAEALEGGRSCCMGPAIQWSAELRDLVSQLNLRGDYLQIVDRASARVHCCYPKRNQAVLLLLLEEAELKRVDADWGILRHMGFVYRGEDAHER